jgi:hypothetical protein
MNANFGLLEELNPVPRDKARKRELYAERALRELTGWMRRSGVGGLGSVKGVRNESSAEVGGQA